MHSAVRCSDGCLGFAATLSEHRERVLWVVDVRPGGAESLAKALPAVRVRADLPDIDEVGHGHLVVGVCPLAAHRWTTAFAGWARAAGVPLFSIAIDERVAFIGPLSVPGHVGCGNCARERIVAAAATNMFSLGQATPRVGPATAGNSDTDGFIVRLIASEVATIDEAGLEHSRLVDHVCVASRDGLILSEHRVIPLARCRVCGGAAVLAPAHSTPTHDEERTTFAVGLGGWVDPLTGIIPSVAVEAPTDEHPGLPVTATAASPQIVTSDDSLQVLPGGWGKGLTPSEAVASAVGEALERYAASIPDPNRIVWARGEDLGGDRLDPGEFSLYSEEQYARAGFPYARFDPVAVHPWVRGRWLGGGDVWVSAVMCYLSLTVAPENLICQGTSNGLAASSTFDDAALRATLELVERDALLAAWLTGECGRRVRIDGALDPSLARVVEAIQSLGASVELYLLPSVCGVSLLCIAFGNGRAWPGATIGLAADLDPGSAARGAILELGQTGPRLRHMLRSGAGHIPDCPEEVKDLIDHATFYFPPENARAFDRVRGSARRISLSSLPSPNDRSLDACAASLEAAQIRVAVVDVTSSDLATGPFRVVRAVSPDLSPLSYGYGLERLPVKRIRSRVNRVDVPPVHPMW